MRHALNRVLFALFSALPLLSCDEALRFTVVEAAGSETAARAGAEQVAGSGAGARSGGDSGGVAGSAGSAVSEGGSLDGGRGGMASSGTETGGDQASAGAAGAEFWEGPALDTASFSSHAHPGKYIQHSDAKGFVSAVDTGVVAERQSATFDVVPGLFDAECISLRAINLRGGFFRHAGSRIYMHPAQDTPLFVADATFCMVPGLADPTGVSFRSSNYPDRVIHLRGESELWIDDIIADDAAFASDSTFFREAPLSELE